LGKADAREVHFGDDVALIPSSGNVFADLGLPDPDLLLAKAELAIAITAIIRERGLSPSVAARELGISQAQLTALKRGQLDVLSLKCLMSLVTRLGQDVEITVTPNVEPRRQGRMVARRQEDGLAASGAMGRAEQARFD
jgi:predicted XRE-type DNA-binding protein